MICMMPKVNLGVEEMEFIFCNLYVYLNNSSLGDMNLPNSPCLISFLPGDTSDSQNLSL